MKVLTITLRGDYWYLLWLQECRVTKLPSSGQTTSTDSSLTCLLSARGQLGPGGHVPAQLHTRWGFAICSVSLLLCRLRLSEARCHHERYTSKEAQPRPICVFHSCYAANTLWTKTSHAAETDVRAGRSAPAHPEAMATV